MKYPVLISSLALEDIAEIFDYISTSFKEPMIASGIKNAILDAIDSLEEYPLRISVVKEEPFRSRGIRKMLVKNYHLFYQIHNDRVIIVRVLYNRREWRDIL